MILQTEVTRLRAPLVSSGYGNSALDWPNATATTYYVHFSFKATTEVVSDEPQTVTRGYLFGGPEVDLQATDRVVGPDGLLYEVAGEVMPSFHPRTGALHHIRAFLKRISITGS